MRNQAAMLALWPSLLGLPDPVAEIVWRPRGPPWTSKISQTRHAWLPFIAVFECDLVTLSCRLFLRVTPDCCLFLGFKLFTSNYKQAAPES
jgi:hypothetical protein